MTDKQSGTQAKVTIVSYYKKATYCYGAPFSFLLMQLLLNAVSNFDFQPFLALFFLTILPFGLAGLVFTKRGFVLASSNGDKVKKDVGYANFILGTILFVLGLLSCAFAYVVTS